MTAEKLESFNRLFDTQKKAVKSSESALKIQGNAKGEANDLVITCGDTTCIVTAPETKSYIMDKVTYFTNRFVTIATKKFTEAK